MYQKKLPNDHSKKYWIFSTLMDVWEKVASLFRSRETEGAVAWTVDGPA